MDAAFEKLRAAVAAESYDGSQIAMNVADNPVCSILLNLTVPCLLLSWRKSATSLQLRFVLETVLRILEAERLEKLIGDDCGIHSMEPADQDWIAHDWMPRAMDAGLHAVASVVPFSYSGQRAIEPVHASVPPGLAIQSFESVEEAKRWLTAPAVSTATLATPLPDRLRSH